MEGGTAMFNNVLHAASEAANNFIRSPTNIPLSIYVGLGIVAFIYMVMKPHKPHQH